MKAFGQKAIAVIYVIVAFAAKATPLNEGLLFRASLAQESNGIVANNSPTGNPALFLRGGSRGLYADASAKTLTDKKITQRTVSFSFREDSALKSGYRVLYSEGSLARGLIIYLYGKKIFVGGYNRPINESDWAGTFLSAEIDSNVWHHVALVLNADRSVLALYLDGKLKSAGLGKAVYPRALMKMGGLPFPVDGVEYPALTAEGPISETVAPKKHSFTGDFRNAAIYDRALTANELAQVFDLDRIGLPSLPAQVWESCRLADETSGTLANLKTASASTRVGEAAINITAPEATYRVPATYSVPGSTEFAKGIVNNILLAFPAENWIENYPVVQDQTLIMYYPRSTVMGQLIVPKPLSGIKSLSTRKLDPQYNQDVCELTLASGSKNFDIAFEARNAPLPSVCPGFSWLAWAALAGAMFDPAGYLLSKGQDLFAYGVESEVGEGFDESIKNLFGADGQLNPDLDETKVIRSLGPDDIDSKNRLTPVGRKKVEAYYRREMQSSTDVGNDPIFSDEDASAVAAEVQKFIDSVESLLPFRDGPVTDRAQRFAAANNLIQSLDPNCEKIQMAQEKGRYLNGQSD